jgi:hypothetical protein
VYEALSPTLREEHRQWIFERGVLRIICPKREEVTGGWRKLDIDKLRGFFSSSDIRVMKFRETG